MPQGKQGLGTMTTPPNPLINPLIAIDDSFTKLLFELEQVNLRLLLEMKQAQMGKTQATPAATAQQLQQRLRPKKVEPTGDNNDKRVG